MFYLTVNQATWLSLIVVVPKKNKKIRVCVDYQKLPFMDEVLDTVGGHKVYSFLDRFNGYNQIRMHQKTAFFMEWGVFIVVVMMFGLETTSETFQRIIMEIFRDYIPAFMQVFLNLFVVYS